MKALEQFKELLNGVHEPSIPLLESAILSINFTNEFISNNITEPAELPYGKNIVWLTKDIQAAFIHLPAYTETFIHNHGDSIGCALVLEGSLINTIYKLDSNDVLNEVSRGIVNRNEFFYAPKNQIHLMSNPHNERAVSFHVYSPSIVSAKTYELPNKAVITK
jgi:cysteine dioxygenase